MLRLHLGPGARRLVLKRGDTPLRLLDLALEGDTVSDVRITGQGCSISQASASMMACTLFTAESNWSLMTT